ESSATVASTGSVPAGSAGPSLWRGSTLACLGQHIAGVCNRQHFIHAVISPDGRGTVADANRDHRKRRSLSRPRRMTVADNDQQIDRIVLPLDKSTNSDADISATTAEQLDLLCSKHLLHVVHGGIATHDQNVRAVSELTGQASQF